MSETIRWLIVAEVIGLAAFPIAYAAFPVFKDRGWRTHAIANVAFLSEAFGATRDFESTDIVAPTSNLEMRAAGATTHNRPTNGFAACPSTKSS